MKYFFLVFILIVVIPNLFLSRTIKFNNVADNITYLMQAESLYYDHDFKLEKKDFLRMYLEYPQIVKKLPIISKKDINGQLTYAKPIFFTIYISLFSWIVNPVYRGFLMNLILSFFLYLIVFKILKNKKLFLLFCVLMFFSQFNFYFTQIHPEIFTNLLVLIAALPMFFNSKKRYLYMLSGLMGGILAFEKQMAIFFPLVTIGYLFFKNRNNFYYYLTNFIIACLFGLGLNYAFHGDVIAYQGLRGLSSFDGQKIYFHSQGIIKPFTFPLAYMERFKEYFFGKILGIFVYNSVFILFLIVFVKNFKKIFIFLPVILYIAGYFFAVDPVFSYGGASTIGNRYFFQIYFYVVSTSLLYLSTLKRKFSVVIIFLFIFSVFIYRPFYRNYNRAIMDHFIIVMNNNKTFGWLPLELSYYQVIFSDLVSENKIEDKIFILNNGIPVNQEKRGKWLPKRINEVIEISEDGNFLLRKKVKVVKVERLYRLNYLFNKGPFIGLFKIQGPQLLLLK